MYIVLKKTSKTNESWEKNTSLSTPPTSFITTSFKKQKQKKNALLSQKDIHISSFSEKSIVTMDILTSLTETNL